MPGRPSWRITASVVVVRKHGSCNAWAAGHGSPPLLPRSTFQRADSALQASASRRGIATKAVVTSKDTALAAVDAGRAIGAAGPDATATGADTAEADDDADEEDGPVNRIAQYEER